MKHCPQCDQDKPLTSEHWLPRKDSKDGYRGVCRLCWYAQQRPNKRRHYQRHAGRIRAERRADRQRRSERRRLADLRYYLQHREQRIAYCRRYYWLNHERLLVYARWYSKHVRPMRIQFGDLPTDHIDRQLWERQQNRQQAQETATTIIALLMRALTEDERHLLMAIEAHEYDTAAALSAMAMGESALHRIRTVAEKVKEALFA